MPRLSLTFAHHRLRPPYAAPTCTTPHRLRSSNPRAPSHACRLGSPAQRRLLVSHLPLKTTSTSWTVTATTKTTSMSQPLLSRQMSLDSERSLPPRSVLESRNHHSSGWAGCVAAGPFLCRRIHRSRSTKSPPHHKIHLAGAAGRASPCPTIRTIASWFRSLIISDLEVGSVLLPLNPSCDMLSTRPRWAGLLLIRHRARRTMRQRIAAALILGRREPPR
jgi:hypothetical protein